MWEGKWGSDPYIWDDHKHLRYKSVMNYWYTYSILDYSDGSHGNGDFDDWGNLDFSFFKNSHFEWPKEE